MFTDGLSFVSQGGRRKEARAGGGELGPGVHLRNSISSSPERNRDACEFVYIS